MTSLLYDLVAGAGVGLVGGLTSGLLGVSPGGGLVVFSVLLLGAEQHVAQGTSLVAQIPPTSLSGIRRYREKGTTSPLSWLAWLSVGFLGGSIGGGYAAGFVASATLQWTYVAYLIVLAAMMMLRGERDDEQASATDRAPEISWLALALVGVVAGFSSGFLGIGGGLAITVGLSVGLGVPQHQAQLVSLVFSIVPTTIPAAWVYWSQGSLVSWPALAGIVIGLWLGADFGARAANRADKLTLRRILLVLTAAMALYMSYKALGN